MKLTETQRRNFVSAFVKQKPLRVTTVQDLKWCNHEIKRTCKNCGCEFDVRKTLEFRCPVCESTNLEIGWKYEKISH